MGEEPLLEFTRFLENHDYIEAVNLVLGLTQLTPKKPFQEGLFGSEYYIFLKALKQAVKNENNSWLNKFLSNQQLSVPSWFTSKGKNYPKWCKEARSRLLTAQMTCAEKAIHYSGITSKGLTDLATAIGFPPAFAYELLEFFQNQQANLIEQRKIIQRREIPALLFLEEMSRKKKADGRAVYLVIEQVELDIQSKPYPHPLKMSDIPFDMDSFQKAIDRAFEHVRHELCSSHGYKVENLPVFRWWVKPAPEEKEIFGLEGPSFYGAFATGMLSLALKLENAKQTAITCKGDEFGNLSKIGGLTQKCQAANRQNWNIIIAKEQDTETGNNDISGIYPPLLLRVSTVREAMTYLTSGIGFEVIDYLDFVYKQWGNLPRNEVSADCPKDAKFDDITESPKVRYMEKGKNTESSTEWDGISKEIRRAVIYGWPKVGKTRLLRYIGRKISQENVEALKKGELNLETVNLPIFLRCTHLADILKEGPTFEEAIFTTLRAEYLINGQPLSDALVSLIKDKFKNGQCTLLFDDFYSENRQKLVDKLNQFARSYPNCKIIVTVCQETKNKKDDYGDLPLEITTQSDEVILELLSPLREVCPYKGLQFFDFNDKDPQYFCGRDGMINDLLKKVENSNFLAVLGNSGSGKSSVVRAGLLHQLESRKLDGSGDEQWKIFNPITPTEQKRSPLKNLARVFVPTELPEREFASEFKKVKEDFIARGAEGLEELIDAIKAPRAVLVIDQFEEIFTSCEQAERQQFFDCLLGALEQTDNKLCLVIVMRADFMGNCTEDARLAHQIKKNLEMVIPMNQDDLRQAILEPAKKVGLGVEQDLVMQILKDMEDSPNILPLLQDVLEQLWRKQKEKNLNWLTLVEYHELGGVKEALEKRANKVYENDLSSKEEQETAQWIFMKLTQSGEAFTSKTVFKEELITAKYTAELVDKTLKKLTDARLVAVIEPEGEQNHASGKSEP
jgi:energy-coupling factor transporter ATP-binding protein EcfA2